jgi:hypothetical protein
MEDDEDVDSGDAGTMSSIFHLGSCCEGSGGR